MAKKITSITMDGELFSTGIGNSPFLGNQELSKLTTSDVPYILKTLPDAGETIAATQIVDMTLDPITGNIWALENNGHLHKYDGSSWTEYSTAGATAGTSLLWNNSYIFIYSATEAQIHNYAIGTNTWGADWQAVTAGGPGPSLESKNGKGYFGTAYGVHSIEYIGGGGIPFTITVNALDMPTGQTVTSLAELGSKIMVGTSSQFNIGGTIDGASSNIYPWDTFSKSFNLPLILGECGIKSMITVNNVLYIIAGNGCNIYRSDGYNVSLIKNIQQASNCNNNDVNNNAIAFMQGKIYIGLTIVDDQATDRATIQSGIYSINLDVPGFPLVKEQWAFTSTTPVTDTFQSLFVSNSEAGSVQRLYIGQYASSITTYSLVRTQNYNTVSDNSYDAVYMTPVFEVGSTYMPRTFSYIEVQFYEAINGALDGLKIEYREYDSHAETGWADALAETVGIAGQQSMRIPFGATVENVQFRFTLVGDMGIKRIIID